MIHTRIDTETQADIKIFGKIDDFFKQFKLATSLHQCGVKKRHGHSVRTLILAIFTLPFVGENFFRGIATNDNLAFGKDAAYNVLKGCKSNWRKLLLSIGTKLYVCLNRLTDEDRESVLIVDEGSPQKTENIVR